MAFVDVALQHRLHVKLGRLLTRRKLPASVVGLVWPLTQADTRRGMAVRVDEGDVALVVPIRAIRILAEHGGKGRPFLLGDLAWVGSVAALQLKMFANRVVEQSHGAS